MSGGNFPPPPHLFFLRRSRLRLMRTLALLIFSNPSNAKTSTRIIATIPRITSQNPAPYGFGWNSRAIPIPVPNMKSKLKSILSPPFRSNVLHRSAGFFTVRISRNSYIVINHMWSCTINQIHFNLLKSVRILFKLVGTHSVLPSPGKFANVSTIFLILYKDSG